MKSKFLNILIIIIINLNIISCSENPAQTEKVLNQAETLLEELPDSALTLLNQTDFPKNLNKSLYYKYILLTIQAKDKNYLDITHDSIIKEASNYFVEVNDYNRAATAMFYWGRINLYNENYQTAINEFLTAIDLAQKAQNFNLLGLIYGDIGIIYRKQLKLEKSIEHYLLAKENFAKAGIKKNEYKILSHIGNIYLRMDPPQIEKALDAHMQALDFAKQENDTLQMITCLNNISVTFREIKNYDNAKKYILESVSLDKNNEHIIKNYSSLIKIHLATGELDSAVFYLNSISPIIEKSKNNFDLYNYNILLHDVYEQKRDYQTALNYYKKSQNYKQQIYDESSEKSIFEIQEKYNNTQTENKYQQTVIKQQRLKIGLSICILIILIIAILCIIIIKSHKRKKAEAEETIETLNNLLSDSNNSNQKLRKKVIEELELTKKVAYIHATDSNKGKQLIKDYDKLFNRNLQKALDWEHLYQLIDELYPTLRAKLNERYPNIMSEKEKQICYLSRAGF